MLAMAISLVYGAEHYVFDIVLGWLYAVVSFLLVVWLQRRWRERTRFRRSPPPPAVEPATPGTVSDEANALTPV
jgi:membrane-associated phospholipid phosphatase